MSVSKKPYSHEETYKKWSLVSLLHNARLIQLFKLINQLPIKDNGTVADYGCSNGYIISLLQGKIDKLRSSLFFGFDYSIELLEIGKLKELKHTHFEYCDLNTLNLDRQEQFDTILCLETLEHVGNYENALSNIYFSAKANGLIVISIPNEVGIIGLTKYLGRKMARYKTYNEFFENKSEWKYFSHLVLNKPIDIFRTPLRPIWGQHLGFDWQVFQTHLKVQYLNQNKLELVLRKKLFLNLGIIYVLRKS